jgi:uncharacterized CHY-type Zn-finger protein
MGLTIRCKKCKKSITFDEFFVNIHKCPNCNIEWDYKGIQKGSKTFRRKN